MLTYCTSLKIQPRKERKVKKAILELLPQAEINFYGNTVVVTFQTEGNPPNYEIDNEHVISQTPAITCGQEEDDANRLEAAY